MKALILLVWYVTHADGTIEQGTLDMPSVQACYSHLLLWSEEYRLDDEIADAYLACIEFPNEIKT